MNQIHYIQNRYLNHLVDSCFQGINRLFVYHLKMTHIKIYKRYFLPTVEIKDYNVMIDRQNFFNQPEKNGLVTYANIQKIAAGQGDD